MYHRWVISTFLWDFSPGNHPVTEMIRGEFRGSPFLPHVMLASEGEELSLLKSTHSHLVYLHYRILNM